MLTNLHSLCRNSSEKQCSPAGALVVSPTASFLLHCNSGQKFPSLKLSESPRLLLCSSCCYFSLPPLVPSHSNNNSVHSLPSLPLPPSSWGKLCPISYNKNLSSSLSCYFISEPDALSQIYYYLNPRTAFPLARLAALSIPLRCRTNLKPTPSHHTLLHSDCLALLRPGAN